MTSPNIYWQTRAIEDAVANPGVRPLRIIRVLWPLWQVHIEAEMHDEQNYAMVESFVLRCVAEAGFDTVTEISEFLGIRVELARRCTRYLTGIKHLTEVGGRLRLTELGAKSLRSEIRLVPKHHEQSVLIDRFERKPLPRRFYDSSISILDTPETEDSNENKFQPVFATTAFSAELVTELAARSDRFDFGLPRHLFNVKTSTQRDGFLPVYLITTVDSGLLAYGPTSTRRDAFLEAIGNRQELLRTLTAAKPDKEPRQLWADYVASPKGVRGIVSQDADGMWRLTMSTATVESNERLKPTSIGTFVIRHTYFIQLWCDDEQLREQAAKGRILNAPMLPGIDDRTSLNTYAHSVCRQLQVPVPDADELRRFGVAADDEWKVERIEKLPD